MTQPNWVVGVVGAGAMGSGIAHVAAMAGHDVILGDAIPEAVEKARAAIAKAVTRDIEKGRLDQAGADAVLARIRDAGDLSSGADAYAECSIVIEAVLEEMSVKRALFARLEKVVRDGCILGSNTSSLSIAALAGASRLPDRVVGIHFFNPAAVLPLVEIVPGIATSATVVDAARALVSSWGKTAVVASDTPGFIVNRIARPFYGESLRQLEEGVADIATIDWAMREVGGFRMGPFELMDFIGNDVNFAVTSTVFGAMFNDPRYRPALTQRRLVDAGFLGRKTGRGYYDYAPDAIKPEPVKDLSLGGAIVDRTLAMLVNEAIDAVFMQVASAFDIDLAMTRGTNYPKGLLAWGDEIGTAEILRRLEALYSEYGEDRYRPSPLLRRRVARGEPLFQ